jgi:hypothetical protein
MAGRNIRVCTVKGKDHRGYPLIVKVEAYSVLEAAARGMEAISREHGVASELEIREHIPGKEWKITTDQLLKWASKRGAEDNVGLTTVKRHVKDFLTKDDKN